MALIALTAGPLQMLFDDTAAFLRHVRLGDRELVRGIFAAVRDRNWDTVPATLSGLNLCRAETHFRLSFDVDAVTDTIAFRWHGTVIGTEAGTVTFHFAGTAGKPFLKNRIGLCVLHPIEPCAGQPCRVTHIDGTQTNGTFPLFISPHQPFKNIQSIRHPVTPQISVEVSFDGDVFEMEDQRNWTDASYKTYSTPLALPFPVQLQLGQQLRQSVTLKLAGDLPVSKLNAAVGRSVPSVAIDWSRPCVIPSIGLGMATARGPLSATALARLAAIRPGHLRVDLPLNGQDWQQRLRDAAEVATALNTQLQVALFLSDAAADELEQLLSELAVQRPPVGLWMIFHCAEKTTHPRWVELARLKLAAWDPAVTFATGTNAYFAELNRERPQPETDARVCFSINPQVHASDNLSLIETLAAQRSTVETARQFSRLPVVISPITLRPRFNPNATEVAAEPPPQSDRRQSTPFAAAWTVGSLGRLASCPGIHSLTYFETAGPRGILGDDDRPYPLYHLFEAIAGGALAFECHCDQPLRVEALALCGKGGRRRVLVANFNSGPQQVLLQTVVGTVHLRRLSAEGFSAAQIAWAGEGGLKLDLPGDGIVMVEVPAVMDAALQESPAETAVMRSLYRQADFQPSP